MKSRLWIKMSPEHAGKRRRAAAYKRLWGGVCGGLTWRELARVSGAGRPATAGPGPDRVAKSAGPRVVLPLGKRVMPGRLGNFGRIVWNKLTGGAGR
jgi:hypothetical protein